MNINDFSKDNLLKMFRGRAKEMQEKIAQLPKTNYENNSKIVNSTIAEVRKSLQNEFLNINVVNTKDKLSTLLM